MSPVYRAPSAVIKAQDSFVIPSLYVVVSVSVIVAGMRRDGVNLIVLCVCVCVVEVSITVCFITSPILFLRMNETMSSWNGQMNKH